jgi:cytochrome P450
MVGEQLISRIRLFSLYWMSDSFEFRRAAGRVKAFTEKYVQAALNTTNTGKVEGKKETLLSRLATETRNAEELRIQTLAILFAGRDTTASLLGWSFLRLSIHPEVVEKLRSVILSDFPDDQPITFAALKDCRYLRHFINEILRLHPTVPLNGRTAIKNTTLPVGGGPDEKSPVAIRKGQAIGFSVYLMHRRKDLWGEDALEFKPERWEQKIPAWQFLPFLGGPRVCIGQQFALVEASYLIVRLLQRYDKIEPVDMAMMKKGRKGLGLTMWPRDGVKVQLHEAAG